ncbi:kinase-like domain-containing protein [Desarmillaria ectypa]|nr:kinase-like domain-containing protein [Desarmillaria ectypa]
MQRAFRYSVLTRLDTLSALQGGATCYRRRPTTRALKYSGTRAGELLGTGLKAVRQAFQDISFDLAHHKIWEVIQVLPISVPDTVLSESTTLPTRPSLPNWTELNLEDEETDVQIQIQSLIRDVPCSWMSVDLISPAVEVMVMDVLQQELDDLSRPDSYRTACMKCLRALSMVRNIVPSSFSSQDVTRGGTNPVCGGGFADIWEGYLHDTKVCLKVLRIFEPEVKTVRDFCQEAPIWRQLRHPNVLPFLGVKKILFAPRYCLISPWVANGNIMSYLKVYPDHNRLTSLAQVAEGMRYLHNLDPPIVHADTRGANILVMDDLRCCLADFGLSLFEESQALGNFSSNRGSIRWLAPEYMDPNLFGGSYITARDIYAHGCTAVEIFTGKASTETTFKCFPR